MVLYFTDARILSYYFLEEKYMQVIKDSKLFLLSCFLRYFIYLTYAYFAR
jgi:hypothetical protein